MYRLNLTERLRKRGLLGVLATLTVAALAFPGGVAYASEGEGGGDPAAPLEPVVLNAPEPDPKPDPTPDPEPDPTLDPAPDPSSDPDPTPDPTQKPGPGLEVESQFQRAGAGARDVAGGVQTFGFQAGEDAGPRPGPRAASAVKTSFTVNEEIYGPSGITGTITASLPEGWTGRPSVDFYGPSIEVDGVHGGSPTGTVQLTLPERPSGSWSYRYVPNPVRQPLGETVQVTATIRPQNDVAAEPAEAKTLPVAQQSPATVSVDSTSHPTEFGPDDTAIAYQASVRNPGPWPIVVTRCGDTVYDQPQVLSAYSHLLDCSKTITDADREARSLTLDGAIEWKMREGDASTTRTTDADPTVLPLSGLKMDVSATPAGTISALNSSADVVFKATMTGRDNPATVVVTDESLSAPVTLTNISGTREWTGTGRVRAFARHFTKDALSGKASFEATPSVAGHASVVETADWSIATPKLSISTLAVQGGEVTSAAPKVDVSVKNEGTVDATSMALKADLAGSTCPLDEAFPATIAAGETVSRTATCSLAGYPGATTTAKALLTSAGSAVQEKAAGNIAVTSVEPTLTGIKPFNKLYTAAGQILEYDVTVDNPGPWPVMVRKCGILDYATPVQVGAGSAAEVPCKYVVTDGDVQAGSVNLQAPVSFGFKRAVGSVAYVSKPHDIGTAVAEHATLRPSFKVTPSTSYVEPDGTVTVDYWAEFSVGPFTSITSVHLTDAGAGLSDVPMTCVERAPGTYLPTCTASVTLNGADMPAGGFSGQPTLEIWHYLDGPGVIATGPAWKVAPVLVINSLKWATSAGSPLAAAPELKPGGEYYVAANITAVKDIGIVDLKVDAPGFTNLVCGSTQLDTTALKQFNPTVKCTWSTSTTHPRVDSVPVSATVSDASTVWATDTLPPLPVAAQGEVAAQPTSADFAFLDRRFLVDLKVVNNGPWTVIVGESGGGPVPGGAVLVPPGAGGTMVPSGFVITQENLEGRQSIELPVVFGWRTHMGMDSQKMEPALVTLNKVGANIATAGAGTPAVWNQPGVVSTAAQGLSIPKLADGMNLRAVRGPGCDMFGEPGFRKAANGTGTEVFAESRPSIGTDMFAGAKNCPITVQLWDGEPNSGTLVTSLDTSLKVDAPALFFGAPQLVRVAPNADGLLRPGKVKFTVSYTNLGTAEATGLYLRGSFEGAGDCYTVSPSELATDAEDQVSSEGTARTGVGLGDTATASFQVDMGSTTVTTVSSEFPLATPALTSTVAAATTTPSMVWDETADIPYVLQLSGTSSWPIELRALGGTQIKDVSAGTAMPVSLEGKETVTRADAANGNYAIAGGFEWRFAGRGDADWKAGPATAGPSLQIPQGSLTGAVFEATPDPASPWGVDSVTVNVRAEVATPDLANVSGATVTDDAYGEPVGLTCALMPGTTPQRVECTGSYVVSKTEADAARESMKSTAEFTVRGSAGSDYAITGSANWKSEEAGFVTGFERVTSDGAAADGAVTPADKLYFRVGVVRNDTAADLETTVLLDGYACNAAPPLAPGANTGDMTVECPWSGPAEHTVTTPRVATPKVTVAGAPAKHADAVQSITIPLSGLDGDLVKVTDLKANPAYHKGEGTSFTVVREITNGSPWMITPLGCDAPTVKIAPGDTGSCSITTTVGAAQADWTFEVDPPIDVKITGDSDSNKVLSGHDPGVESISVLRAQPSLRIEQVHVANLVQDSAPWEADITFTITNTGNVPISDIQVSLPELRARLQANFNTVPVGESETVTFTKVELGALDRIAELLDANDEISLTADVRGKLGKEVERIYGSTTVYVRKSGQVFDSPKVTYTSPTWKGAGIAPGRAMFTVKWVKPDWFKEADPGGKLVIEGLPGCNWEGDLGAATTVTVPGGKEMMWEVPCTVKGAADDGDPLTWTPKVSVALSSNGRNIPKAEQEFDIAPRTVEVTSITPDPEFTYFYRLGQRIGYSATVKNTGAWPAGITAPGGKSVTLAPGAAEDMSGLFYTITQADQAAGRATFADSMEYGWPDAPAGTAGAAAPFPAPSRRIPADQPPQAPRVTSSVAEFTEAGEVEVTINGEYDNYFRWSKLLVTAPELGLQDAEVTLDAASRAWSVTGTLDVTATDIDAGTDLTGTISMKGIEQLYGESFDNTGTWTAKASWNSARFHELMGKAVGDSQLLVDFKATSTSFSAGQEKIEFVGSMVNDTPMPLKATISDSLGVVEVDSLQGGHMGAAGPVGSVVLKLDRGAAVVPAGDTVRFSGTYTVKASDVTAKSLSNTVTVGVVPHSDNTDAMQPFTLSKTVTVPHQVASSAGGSAADDGYKVAGTSRGTVSRTGADVTWAVTASGLMLAAGALALAGSRARRRR